MALSNHSLGGQVTQSSITESSQVYSTFKRKKKSSKDHTNKIYDKFLSESQSKEPSQILMFKFSSSFMAASKENREETTALPAALSFLSAVQVPTNPALQFLQI